MGRWHGDHSVIAWGIFQTPEKVSGCKCEVEVECRLDRCVSNGLTDLAI